MSSGLAISRRCSRVFRRLLRDEGGVAFIELAYSLPFLTFLGLGGVETANYAMTHMRVSQIAISLADNASRVKQQIVSGVPRMREVDVNEVFLGAQLQSGNLDITANGRMILSSLEVNGDGGQWIHWQRCMGDADYSSTFGIEDDGEFGTSLAGMGPEGGEVVAETNYAINFVEVAYDYKPLIFGEFIPDRPIRKFAAMFVRDDRNLSQIFNPSPTVTPSSCS